MGSGRWLTSSRRCRKNSLGMHCVVHPLLLRASHEGRNHVLYHTIRQGGQLLESIPLTRIGSLWLHSKRHPLVMLDTQPVRPFQLVTIMWINACLSMRAEGITAGAIQN